MDLLLEDPPITQNGQHFEELITPCEDNPKSVANYMNDLLDELDPMKSVVEVEIEYGEEPSTEVDSQLSVAVLFADLLAGGELKFKKNMEIPNDVIVKKV
jgi:hypothetical protein